MSALPKESPAPVSDTLTVLTCHKNLNLTKIYTSSGVRSYDEAAAFAVSSVSVTGIRELSNKLLEMQKQPHKCLIRGTFESIIKLERCPSLDTAESIAKSSGYELWQMLAPNFHPMNPPLVRDMSNDEIAFYARLADLVKQELPK